MRPDHLSWRREARAGAWFCATWVGERARIVELDHAQSAIAALHGFHRRTLAARDSGQNCERNDGQA